MPQPDYGPRTDEELLRAANQGDCEAFAEFCSRSLPRLNVFLRGLCTEWDIGIDHAEDFTSEALSRAINSACGDGTRPRCLSFTWLKSIGTNVAKEHLRRKTCVVFTPLSDRCDESYTTYDDIRRADEIEEVLKFLDWCRADHRYFLELVLQKGLTAKEACAELGLDPKDANKFFWEAVGNIKDLMELHGQQAIPVR